MTTEPTQARAWTADELARLDHAPLIRVAGARADGTLRPFVLVGHVRVGDHELIRSLNGTRGVWYRGATRTGFGEIDVDGRRIRVTFVRDSGREAEVDQALRARYGNDAPARQASAHRADGSPRRGRRRGNCFHAPVRAGRIPGDPRRAA